MKKIIKFLVFAFISLAVVSCKDMNALHEVYLEKGEVIYTNKVDSLNTYSGKGRLMIWGILESAFNVDEVVVTWNDGNDMEIFPYTKSDEDADTLNLVVTGLEEGNYEFSVYSKDADGNQSIPVTLFGTVYGEIFRSTLVPRPANGFSYNGPDTWLKFETSDENQRKTEIKYRNTGGEEITEELSREKDTAALSGYDLGTDIVYRTYYVPTQARENGMETSIDQFDSDWKTLALPDILPVLESMTFTGVLGGVKVNWENTEEQNLKVKVTYTVDGEEKIREVESSAAQGEVLVSGMKGAEQEVSVTVSDLFDFSFTKPYTVEPVKAVLLDKSAWTVTDLSTEEPAEGAPNGLASAAIDGDLGTYWHTQWSGGSPGYPHYFAVDMGTEKTIASFEVFRRQGDGRGQTKHKFYISDDGTNWTEIGTFDMDPETDAGQNFSIPSNPVVRYFKYEATEGSDFFAFLAEINIYGLE